MKEDKKGEEKRWKSKNAAGVLLEKIIIFMKQQNEEKWKKSGDVG